MAVETVTVGRLTLHETFPAQLENDSAGAVALSGIEYADTLTPADTRRLTEDIRGLTGTLVPVSFSARPETAFYARVVSADVAVQRYGTQADVITWKLTLDRYGTPSEADIESRLTGPQTRDTDFAVAGERWHAPAVGHYSYFTPDASPGAVVRAGLDGPVTVYRSVPVGTSPRWGCEPADYLKGAARFEMDGHARTGVGLTPAVDSWVLTNGLVRVEATGISAGRSDFAVYHWSNSAWQQKVWTINPGVTYGAPLSTTVLYNDPEAVAVRVLYHEPLIGRVTVDLLLRRGSRFVEAYTQAQTSTTLQWRLVTTEPGTAGTGYVRATANDANGDRCVVGSAHTHTAITTTVGLSLATTTTLDAFLGAEVGGTVAISGDQASNLLAQYLGTPGEYTTAVRR